MLLKNTAEIRNHTKIEFKTTRFFYMYLCNAHYEKSK